MGETKSWQSRSHPKKKPTKNSGLPLAASLFFVLCCEKFHVLKEPVNIKKNRTLLSCFSVFILVLGVFFAHQWATPHVQAQNTCTVQGYKMFGPNIATANEAVVFNATVGIDGTNFPSSAGNPYFLSVTPGAHTAALAGVDESAYNIGYTLCNNRTDCHTATPTPGKSAPINCESGYIDLWWHVTAKSGTTPPPTGDNIIIRTSFFAVGAQRPTEPPPVYGPAPTPDPLDNFWPRVAVYLNNGQNYDGLADAACTGTTGTAINQAGCGTPNKYMEKLVEEFEVSGATFSKDLTVPVGNLTFPHPQDATKKYTKLSYVFHNDYWNPGLNLNRDMGITKIEFLEQGTNRVLRTLIPSETNNYITGTGGIKVGMYYDGGVVSFQGVVDSTQDGMVKAFDAQEKTAPIVNQDRWFMEKEAAFSLIFDDLGSLLQCQNPNEGDVDNDKDVDIFDYSKLLEDFGKTGSSCFSPADINGDGVVDIFDFNKLLAAFGRIYS